MKKTKIYEGMWLGSIILLITVITFLGITSLLKKIETKSAEAGIKTGEFIRNPANVQVSTEFNLNLLREQNRAIKRANFNTVQGKIVYYSDIYNVDTETALRIAECESGFNPNAENVNGSATGVYQFIRKTWKKYCSGDVYNPDANIICFMEYYPIHPEWWECK